MTGVLGTGLQKAIPILGVNVYSGKRAGRRPSCPPCLTAVKGDEPTTTQTSCLMQAINMRSIGRFVDQSKVLQHPAGDFAQLDRLIKLGET